LLTILPAILDSRATKFLQARL